MDDDVYRINIASIESASILSKLWKDTFSQAYKDVHTPENIQAYCTINFSIEMAISELKNNKVICKIATLDDDAVGFYLLKEHDCPVPLDGSSTELKQIYILSNHFGKGLGKMLFEDAMQSIKQNGRGHVWLCVSDINYRAKAFYNKLGFKAVGTGPIFVVGSDRLTSTVLAKVT